MYLTHTGSELGWRGRSTHTRSVSVFPRGFLTAAAGEELGTSGGHVSRLGEKQKEVDLASSSRGSAARLLLLWTGDVSPQLPLLFAVEVA